LEARKVLLVHRNGDITTHYSAPELEELLETANKVCGEQSGTGYAKTKKRLPRNTITDWFSHIFMVSPEGLIRASHSRFAPSALVKPIFYWMSEIRTSDHLVRRKNGRDDRPFMVQGSVDPGQLRP
jgi:hypothetical protein